MLYAAASQRYFLSIIFSKVFSKHQLLKGIFQVAASQRYFPSSSFSNVFSKQQLLKGIFQAAASLKGIIPSDNFVRELSQVAISSAATSHVRPSGIARLSSLFWPQRSVPIADCRRHNLNFGKFQIWEISTLEIFILEIVGWKVAHGKMPLRKYLALFVLYTV